MVEESPKGSQTSDQQKKKLLHLMRFWLIGTFVIVWAATFAYIAMFADKNIGATLGAGWPIWLITAVVCVIAYFGYSFYLNRKI